MAQADSSQLVAQSKTKKISTKKIAKASFAALVSAGLVGTFALPAFSSPGAISDSQFAAQPVQTYTAVEVPDAEFNVAALPVGENTELLLAEQAEEDARLEREREEQQRQIALQQQQQQQQQQAAAAAASVPAGSGAGGLINASLAQLGVAQDCTDLVQNSLAAIGKDVRRDQGGYDRGPGLGDWAGFGTVLPGGAAILPGDILVWEGAHVAIATGGGMAVHGGVGPGGLGTQHMTVALTYPGPVPSSIVRPN